ncbi:PREDICTED: uncharacterized protein LOC106746722 isoform X2 [Dinoponera quadriceps]|nr:PREDICTED: uncharacterized protein LOC106746722 isoform X2 [Dinoponera quadriceps]XP_014479077.1 PREDICTED: uncharacterized protein LOC106746722 isoform X2 [Dinoponera quadriceps]XP_014479078.1 PREDICTED: uncharacterized protein LOC106746722 isoform X2 [Dinoponera quadriceps]
MGQITSRTPETWKSLMNERDYILHWSSEVLARVQDNVTNEDTFLIDYDDDKVDAKIETWITASQARVDEMLNKYPNMSYECKTVVTTKMEQLSAELRENIRKNYQHAYNDIRKLNKRVDFLGRNGRKIHFKIQKLEEKCAGNTQKFQKKLRPLRVKIFNNLIISERMMFQDKRLKIHFTKKVYDIDHKISANYAKQVEKLLRDFENSTREERLDTNS